MPEAYKCLSRHLRPTGKLTCSAVHFETVHDRLFIQPIWGHDSAGLGGVGRVFGCAVTELCLDMTNLKDHGTRAAVQL